MNRQPAAIAPAAIDMPSRQVMRIHSLIRHADERIHALQCDIRHEPQSPERHRLHNQLLGLRAHRRMLLSDLEIAQRRIGKQGE